MLLYNFIIPAAWRAKRMYKRNNMAQSLLLVLGWIMVIRIRFDIYSGRLPAPDSDGSVNDSFCVMVNLLGELRAKVSVRTLARARLCCARRACARLPTSHSPPLPAARFRARARARAPTTYHHHHLPPAFALSRFFLRASPPPPRASACHHFLTACLPRHLHTCHTSPLSLSPLRLNRLRGKTFLIWYFCNSRQNLGSVLYKSVDLEVVWIFEAICLSS